jgi:hypothetical protein
VRAKICVSMAGLLAEQKFHGLQLRFEEDIVKELVAIRAARREELGVFFSDLRAIAVTLFDVIRSFVQVKPDVPSPTGALKRTTSRRAAGVGWCRARRQGVSSPTLSLVASGQTGVGRCVFRRIEDGWWRAGEPRGAGGPQRSPRRILGCLQCPRLRDPITLSNIRAKGVHSLAVSCWPCHQGDPKRRPLARERAGPDVWPKDGLHPLRDHRG